MGLYSRFVLPNLIACGCGMAAIGEERRKVVPRAHGVVLELGMGAGANLPFYDPAKVERVFGLEPEAGMLPKARRAAARATVPVTVLPEMAEHISLPERSVDTVLVTYALCTIPDVVQALQAARRVLKPGGCLLFCEHGLAPDPKPARLQARIEPAWKRVFGGCHLTRDIPALIRHAGFQVQDLDASYADNAPRFAGYMYRGSAVAASPSA
jgi:ubiquinone/menaquinone biosynthesis C-methylase UbiE